MGLIFALQPDLRTSTDEKLLLKSSKRRFGLGGGFIFGAALLGTMYLAAAPLFKVLWTDGNAFDRLVTGLIYTSIFLYPVIAFFCWFYQEVVELHARSDGSYDIEAFETVLGLKWNRRAATRVRLNEFVVDNWKGAVNVAAVGEKESGRANRYSTRGHWILKLKPSETHPQWIYLERRAKREDIDLLLAQIVVHFKRDPASVSS